MDSVEFLGWVLNLAPDQFRFREWLDPRKISLPGEPDRTGDTVASIENVAQGGVPWAIAIEFQGDPHSLMFSRALIYMASVWSNSKPDDERGSRYQVGFVVVNLTGAGRAGREMSWPEAGMNLAFQPVERNLEQESADELLSAIESGSRSKCLLPWIPLMRGADEIASVTRWKTLADTELNGIAGAGVIMQLLLWFSRKKRTDTRSGKNS
jgi:hypothetical protein